MPEPVAHVFYLSGVEGRIETKDTGWRQASGCSRGKDGGEESRGKGERQGDDVGDSSDQGAETVDIS